MENQVLAWVLSLICFQVSSLTAILSYFLSLVSWIIKSKVVETCLASSLPHRKGRRGKTPGFRAPTTFLTAPFSTYHPEYAAQNLAPTLFHNFLFRSWKALCVIIAGAAPIVVEEVSWAALLTTLKDFSMVTQLLVIFMGTTKTGAWKGLNQLLCASLES